MKEFVQKILLLPVMAVMFFIVGTREDRRAILAGIFIACIPLYILGLLMVLARLPK